MVQVCTDIIRIKPKTGLIKRGFYMDPALKENLDRFLIPAARARWDAVTLVTGIEGSGKTTLASQICKYIAQQVDKPFGLDQIVFTQQQLMEIIDTAPPLSVIQFDEAAMAALAQDATSAMQVALIKKFITIRKKQLFIIMLIPSIFLLRRYFAIFRTRCCIHTSTPDGITRGWFKFYSYDTKRLLYIRGIKEFDQGCVTPDFDAQFQDSEGLIYDPVAYDKKKEDAIRSITEAGEKAKEALSKRQQKIKDEHNILALANYKLLKHFVELKGEKKFTYKHYKAFLQKKFLWPSSEAALKASVNEALLWIGNKKTEQEKIDKGSEQAKV